MVIGSCAGNWDAAAGPDDPVAAPHTLLSPLATPQPPRPHTNATHLDQALHAQAARGGDEVGQVGVWEHGGDEQHGVGAGGAGLDDLIPVDDKLFAQQGAAHARAADQTQVLKPALEELGVGEHRQARCAAGLVRPRNLSASAGGEGVGGGETGGRAPPARGAAAWPRGCFGGNAGHRTPSTCIHDSKSRFARTGLPRNRGPSQPALCTARAQGSQAPPALLLAPLCKNPCAGAITDPNTRRCSP